VTGWQTIYALRRALQAELGLTPVTSGFGPQTTAAFNTKVGRITEYSQGTPNILRILSGSLWCKGYQGLYGQSAVSFENLAASVLAVRTDLGINDGLLCVDVKLMSSLLSMDAYTQVAQGKSSVRSVQQWLNRTYSARADFGLIPCDGVYSRQVQQAMMFALQYEMGMADGVANGFFGPGTKDGLRTKAVVGSGSSDSSRHFVRLFQASLRFNSVDAPFDGVFASSTVDAVNKFQSFMEIPTTGRGDYTTWCNLLVSCGDTTAATKGFDTSTRLLGGRAQGARALGYTHVGRYTVGSGEKPITAPELDLLRAAGLRLFPIHQINNNAATYTTYAEGKKQGIQALERCRMLGLPADSVVYFAIDFDPDGDLIAVSVMDYFRGVNDGLNSVKTNTYKAGVYGTRNVCTQVINAGKAVGAFVSGMSTGYSGNMGFPMPTQWHYNQVIEVSEPLGGVATPVDHDRVSSRAPAIDLSQVVSPPIERDGSATTTGFDALFEWFVRAEIACESALSDIGLDTRANGVSEWVLDWIRKPTYWGQAASGMWLVYTPNADSTTMLKNARAVVAQALGAMDPPKPVTGRDAAHWAVTCLGYRGWGVVPKSVNDYTLGDLGGWLLDLLQAFGTWQTTYSNTPLASWLAANLGTDASTFGMRDVVADVDACLMESAWKAKPAVLYSTHMRDILRLTPAQRISKFYSDRFGRSPNAVGLQMQRLADGIDYEFTVNWPLSTNALQLAAHAQRMPTPQEADTLGRAFAAYLARF
jgi:peptidoglycan hydrolase-like protein with peptidoglycan-binding domain